MDLWNRKEIYMPPINSVKMMSVDIDITQLKSIFNSALEIMEKKHLLHKEAALLSRYIYMVQRIMRGQKGLMYMYKVNQGLKRYMSLDLQQVYSNFSMMLSHVDDNDECIYVPTKQMLQYVLVRTQGFCKVMNYLSIACQNAAAYFREILRMGHCINRSVLCLSMISRIWYCTNYFMISACQWYNQLLPYLEKLKIKGLCWLPTEYEFPDNLRSWLGPNLIFGELKYDADVKKISRDVSQINNFKDWGTVVRRKDFYAMKKEKVCIPFRRNVEISSSLENGKLLTTTLDDLGEPISHDHFHTQQVKNENPSVGKNMFNTILQDDLGQPISRDQFLSQKAKNKIVSVIDEFTKHSCNSQSKNEKHLFQTTRDIDNSSLKSSARISKESVENGQFSLMAAAGNNTNETHSFGTNWVTGRENYTDLKKVFPTALKPNKLRSNISEMSINITKSCIKTANKERKTGLANKCPSPKALTHSVDYSEIIESESFKKNDCNSNKIGLKKSIDTSLSNRQTDNKFVQTIKSFGTVKEYEDTASTFDFECDAKQVSNVSEDQHQCTITSRSLLKKKNNNSLGNWEIINGIRTLKDVKVFLHSEKKARAKAKNCVTSNLNNSEWIVLFEAVNKFLKKKRVSKQKGNKKMKSIMEEIRNTLISFVI